MNALRSIINAIDPKTLTGKGILTGVAGALFMVFGFFGLPITSDQSMTVATGLMVVVAGVLTALQGQNRRTLESLGSTADQRAKKRAEERPLEG